MTMRIGIHLIASSVAVLASAAVAAVGGETPTPFYHDAAYGISATGAAPLPAAPTVSSTDGSTRSKPAGARTSDGSVSIGSATVRAGAGKASATVTDFSALDGLVTAMKVIATCDNAAVTSSADGPAAGALGEKGSITYGVKTHNDDGSTSIIGMRVLLTANAATPAATINVAAATCAANDPIPSPSATTTPPEPTTSSEPTTPRPSPTSAKPTTTPPTRTTSTAPTPTAPTRTADITTAPLDPNEPFPTSISNVVPTDTNEQPRTTLRPAPIPAPRTTHLPVTG